MSPVAPQQYISSMEMPMPFNPRKLLPIGDVIR